MTAIVVDRGEKRNIVLGITDPINNSLLGKRVTWTVAKAGTSVALLKKVGGLPGSSGDIQITQQSAGSIDGVIFLLPADYALLPGAQYVTSLWIDSGAGDDECVTPNGTDTLTINFTAPRT